MTGPRYTLWNDVLTRYRLAPTKGVRALLIAATAQGIRSSPTATSIAIEPISLLLAALHPEIDGIISDPEDLAAILRFQEALLESPARAERVRARATKAFPFLGAAALLSPPSELLVSANFANAFAATMGAKHTEPRVLTMESLLRTIAIHPGEEFDQQLGALFLDRHALSRATLRQSVDSGEHLITGHPTIETAPPSAVGTTPPAASTAVDDAIPQAEMGDDIAAAASDTSDLGTTTQGPVPDSSASRAPLEDKLADAANAAVQQDSAVHVAMGGTVVLQREGMRFVLGVDTYAAALATVFREARGEFCFAVFGKWGRGKTVLSQRLEKNLRTKDGRSLYSVARFSAWKYKRTPEAWYFLYETLAAEFKKAGAFTRACRFARERAARYGRWGAIWRLGALLFATLPFSAYFNTIGALAPILGAVGLVYVIALVLRLGPKFGTLSQQYSRLADHRSRLGIQATVGDDLRALMLGWIPRAKRIRAGADWSSERASLQTRAAQPLSDVAACVWTAVWPTMCIVIATVAWYIILFDSLGWTQGAFGECPGSSYLRDLCLLLTTTTAPSSSPPVLYILPFWIVVATFFLCAVQLPRNTVDRVLLVIDDLDRCSPSEAIEIVEAMKLLLEEEEIAARLQVLILADETALAHAIETKFASLIDSKLDDAVAREKIDRSQRSSLRRQIAGDLVREHMDKLFACHLRLEPLSHTDVVSLVQSVTNEYLEQITPSERRNAGLQEESRSNSEVAGTSADQPIGSSQSEDLNTGYHSQTNYMKPVPLSEGEIAAIRAYFKNAPQPISDASPRSLRTFIFKYQLCRLLLQLTGHSVQPFDILDELAAQMRDPSRERISSPLRSFAAQVV